MNSNDSGCIGISGVRGKSSDGFISGVLQIWNMSQRLGRRNYIWHIITSRPCFKILTDILHF
jgi:hypothetical protein